MGEGSKGRGARGTHAIQPSTCFAESVRLHPLCYRSGFCDGASHQRKDPYRQSPYDTGIFLLQVWYGTALLPIDLWICHFLCEVCIYRCE